jgi:NAD-dependent DNA ligase
MTTTSEPCLATSASTVIDFRLIIVRMLKSIETAKTTVTKAADGVGKPLAGVAFILTGEFDEHRDKLTAKLESLGGVSKSSVSKNVTHFVCGENAGKSKLLKYEKLAVKGCAIKKVGKEWVADVLEAAGMGMKNASFAVEEV